MEGYIEKDRYREVEAKTTAQREGGGIEDEKWRRAEGETYPGFHLLFNVLLPLGWKERQCKNKMRKTKARQMKARMQKRKGGDRMHERKERRRQVMSELVVG